MTGNTTRSRLRNFVYSQTNLPLLAYHSMKRHHIKPGPGQESVWDYPRPPKLEPFSGHIRIVFEGEILADTNRAYRVLETSHPPVYYLPPADIRMEHMVPSQRSSFCEFKGSAVYYHVKGMKQAVPDCAWAYPVIQPAYQPIAGYVAFYAHLMDACYVNDELVDAQAGNFYGGWITSKVVGPFKGEPGTWGW